MDDSKEEFTCLNDRRVCLGPRLRWRCTIAAAADAPRLVHHDQRASALGRKSASVPEYAAHNRSSAAQPGGIGERTERPVQSVEPVLSPVPDGGAIHGKIRTDHGRL